MPSYQGHLIGGVFVFSVIATVPYTAKFLGHPDLVTSFSLLAACLLGSLFPDIDIQSKGRNVFYYVLVGLGAIALSQQLFGLTIFFTLLGIVPVFIQHRGLTHNPLFVIGIPFIAAKIITPIIPKIASLQMHYYIFFVAGALSHIILDFMPYKLFGVTIKPKQKRWTKKGVARRN
ncbi:metal-dependent hydrolase [Candidatus Babeliales bacterium]|nr:metal-dependent hydrolase [Candidatus Babeliales bacterium]